MKIAVVTQLRAKGDMYVDAGHFFTPKSPKGDFGLVV